MTHWERRTLGLLALGGSFLGFVLGFTTLFAPGALLAKILLVPFLGMYVWGAWCGIRMIEAHEKALIMNAWFWAVQIPYLTSSIAGYLFASGSLVYLTYAPASSTTNLSYHLGSQFEYSINQADKPLAFGVNLFALAALVLLIYRARKAPPNNSFKPTPLRGAA